MKTRRAAAEERVTRSQARASGLLRLAPASGVVKKPAASHRGKPRRSQRERPASVSSRRIAPSLKESALDVSDGNCRSENEDIDIENDSDGNDNHISTHNHNYNHNISNSKNWDSNISKSNRNKTNDTGNRSDSDSVEFQILIPASENAYVSLTPPKNQSNRRRSLRSNRADPDSPSYSKVSSVPSSLPQSNNDKNPQRNPLSNIIFNDNSILTDPKHIPNLNEKEISLVESDSRTESETKLEMQTTQTTARINTRVFYNPTSASSSVHIREIRKNLNACGRNATVTMDEGIAMTTEASMDTELCHTSINDMDNCFTNEEDCAELPNIAPESCKINSHDTYSIESPSRIQDRNSLEEMEKILERMETVVKRHSHVAEDIEFMSDEDHEANELSQYSNDPDDESTNSFNFQSGPVYETPMSPIQGFENDMNTVDTCVIPFYPIAQERGQSYEYCMVDENEHVDMENASLHMNEDDRVLPDEENNAEVENIEEQIVKVKRKKKGKRKSAIFSRKKIRKNAVKKEVSVPLSEQPEEIAEDEGEKNESDLENDDEEADEAPVEDPDVVIHEEENEDPNKLYCYCRKPYDEEMFYIQCDCCDEWFHGVCVDTTEEQGEALALWFCPDCQKTKGRRIIPKKRCAASLLAEQDKSSQKNIQADESKKITPETTISDLNATSALNNEDVIVMEAPPESNKDAISIYTRPPFKPSKKCKKYLPTQPAHPSAPRTTISGGPNSLYCSDACGLSMARHMINDAIRLGLVPYKSDKKYFPEEDKRDLDYEDYLQRLDEYQRYELTELRIEWREIRARIRALEARLEWILEVVERIEELEESNDGDDDGNNLCGFDYRIVNEWVVPSGKLWNHLMRQSRKSIIHENDGFDIPSINGTMEHFSKNAVNAMGVCNARRNDCCEHEDWMSLKVAEAEQEISDEVKLLQANVDHQRRIMASLRRRRQLL